MNILGYSAGEWLALISIFGVLISFLVWLVREVIMKPNSEQNHLLTNTIDRLSDKVDEFSQETRENRELINQRLEEHDRRLDRHHERIAILMKHDEEERNENS